MTCKESNVASFSQLGIELLFQVAGLRAEFEEMEGVMTHENAARELQLSGDSAYQ